MTGATPRKLDDTTLAEAIAHVYNADKYTRFIKDTERNGPLFLDKEGHIVSLEGVEFIVERDDSSYIGRYERYTVLSGPRIGQTLSDNSISLQAPEYKPNVISNWALLQLLLNSSK